MPEFAIMNNIVGVREKTPHIKLSQAFMVPESKYAFFDYDAVRRLPGRTQTLLNNGSGVTVPDGNPIIRYHLHTDTTGNDYFFAYTKANVYRWNSGTDAYDLMFTSASDVDYWSTASFNGKLISTNFVDLIQVWDDTTPGTAFADMESATGIDIGSGVMLTKAKFVIVFENYLHFFYVEEGGVTYPTRHDWSSLGDETDFDRDGAGDAGARDYTLGKYISGIGLYTGQNADVLVTFTNSSIETEWLVTDSLVFQWDTHISSLGCAAPDTIVNDVSGNLYFYGTDLAFHRLFDPNSLSVDIFETLQNTHPTLRYFSRAIYLSKFNRIWLSIPSSADSTDNDLVVTLNLDLLTWDPDIPIVVTAFGKYSQQESYTIDTIPFATIDTIGWPTIDNTQAVQGVELDICGDGSGNTYLLQDNPSLDAGAAYESQVILATDLTASRALPVYKRFPGFWAWFKRTPGINVTVTISIQTSDSDSYVQVASFDTSEGNGETSHKWCPCDIRGKDFLILIAVSNDFAFYGLQFPFEFDGER